MPAGESGLSRETVRLPLSLWRGSWMHVAVRFVQVFGALTLSMLQFLSFELNKMLSFKIRILRKNQSTSISPFESNVAVKFHFETNPLLSNLALIVTMHLSDMFISNGCDTSESFVNEKLNPAEEVWRILAKLCGVRWQSTAADAAEFEVETRQSHSRI